MTLRLTVLSRDGCGLCDEMLEELRVSPLTAALALEILDVDATEEHRRRYGHKVPVLLMNGELVCHGRLDEDELHKSLAFHRAAT